MTGYLLCVATVRFILLRVSILAVLAFMVNADSEGSDCYTEIKVRHQTKYEAKVGGDLTINCRVVFCKQSPPSVTWRKFHHQNPVLVNTSNHIKTEWKETNSSERIYYLTFNKILRNDSGQYQCLSGSDVSHVINVSVNNASGISNSTTRTTTNNTTNDPQPKKWMYMYSAAGIVVFVIVVIFISVIAMQGCKGKPKTGGQSENEYIAIPMLEGSNPQPLQRQSPRGSTPQGHPDHVYGQVKKDQVVTSSAEAPEDRPGSVVYAALNHQPPASAAPRPWRKQEEISEYAAIRVS